MIENNEVTIVRDDPITERKMSVPADPVSADELREIYLNKVNSFMKKLQYSVCKQYDPAPSPAAFQSEISHQCDLMKEVLFLQECRAAIEAAVESGRGEARGEKTVTAFIRQEDGLILVVPSGD